MAPLPMPVSKPAQPHVIAADAAEALGHLIETTYDSSNIRFYLNGRAVTLNNPNPHWTLLDFIRAQHGLKGTKLGCGEGGCGACTVVLQVPASNLNSEKKVKHLAINACLFPLIGVDGKHVITVEGLGDSANPHPLQERIAKAHGSQCGFCTPGIVMSLYALVRNSYDPEKDEFRLSERDIEAEGHLDGNLCRCTGYKPILQAAKTFITVDLKGHLTEDSATAGSEKEQGIESKVEGSKSNSCGSRPVKSCGRSGGCCRDASPAGSSDAESGSAESTEATSLSSLDSSMKVTITQEPKPDDTVSGASYAKPVKSKEDNPDEKTGVEGKKTVT
ncbi:hypothetical protein LTS18_013330, partial [Coniosporium uncinatum]